MACCVDRCAVRRTLLRAGRGETANETRSLFKIGNVRDVNRIGGTFLAAAALGSDAVGAFLHEQIVWLVRPDGELEPFHDVEAEQPPEGARRREYALAASGGE